MWYIDVHSIKRVLLFDYFMWFLWENNRVKIVNTMACKWGCNLKTNQEIGENGVTWELKHQTFEKIGIHRLAHETMFNQVNWVVKESLSDLGKNLLDDFPKVVNYCGKLWSLVLEKNLIK
jgi:hypothetical protein